jgi:hypothetical protein
VRIFEPTHDTGGTVLSLIGSHYASGDSGFRRVDEVVEVPLVTGLLADVVLYLPMDGSLHNEVGDDLIATDDGAVFEPGRYGEALLPVGKVVLSPPPPDGTSFTLAFWARPPAGATGAIEVVGFYPP